MAEKDDNEDLDIVRKEGDVFEGQCDFCHYETTVTRYNSLVELDGNERALPENKGRITGHRLQDFCEVCASTPASIAKNYPSQFSDESTYILRTVTYIGNMILNTLKDTRLG